MEIIFWSGTISLGPAQYVNQYFIWHKKFGAAQSILEPVEGQGKRVRQHIFFWTLGQTWNPITKTILAKSNFFLIYILSLLLSSLVSPNSDRDCISNISVSSHYCKLHCTYLKAVKSSQKAVNKQSDGIWKVVRWQSCNSQKLLGSSQVAVKE